MSINRASTQKAFTLIELLVAITILSMIFTILFTGLRTGVRTRDALETKTDRVENIHLVQNLLRRQLRQILPALIPDEDENDEDGGRIAFLGLEDRIVIVAPLANRMDFPGLQKLTLRIRDNSTADAVHKQLVLNCIGRAVPVIWSAVADSRNLLPLGGVSGRLSVCANGCRVAACDIRRRRVTRRWSTGRYA